MVSLEAETESLFGCEIRNLLMQRRDELFRVRHIEVVVAWPDQEGGNTELILPFLGTGYN